MRGLRGYLAAAVAAALTATLMFVPSTASANPVTPGNVTAYGFDQCEAPSQKAMNHWLARSPFLSVGIYISGASRGCRAQTHLTPRWVSTQLKKGWKLLPITLGPQASCSTRFPRYGNDPTINPRPGSDGTYRRARVQGRDEATKTVRRARHLGLVRGSTMYYDLEGFDTSRTRCRESALHFLSAWTNRIRDLGYKSGVYSSAASGIRALDNARVRRPSKFHLPDQIWIADWDGRANTSSTYVRDKGWRPARRIKQYQGGHKETWGGVTINIDRNYVGLGRGKYGPPVYHCGTREKFVKVSFTTYRDLRQGMNNRQVTALKCLLKERFRFSGVLNGYYGKGLVAAVNAYKRSRGWNANGTWSSRAWVSLLAKNQIKHVKFGSRNETTRNLQRALNAARPGLELTMTGVFRRPTTKALRAYQKRHNLHVVGVANGETWRKLKRGYR